MGNALFLGCFSSENTVELGMDLVDLYLDAILGATSIQLPGVSGTFHLFQMLLRHTICESAAKVAEAGSFGVTLAALAAP